MARNRKKPLSGRKKAGLSGRGFYTGQMQIKWQQETLLRRPPALALVSNRVNRHTMYRHKIGQSAAVQEEREKLTKVAVGLLNNGFHNLGRTRKSGRVQALLKRGPNAGNVHAINVFHCVGFQGDRAGTNGTTVDKLGERKQTRWDARGHTNIGNKFGA